MIKVFITETMPSLNKGEAAILYGLLETFKVLGDTKVSVYSFCPEIDTVRYGSIARIIGKGGLIPKPTGRISRILEFGFSLFNHLFFLSLYKIIGIDATKIMKKEIWKTYCQSDIIITAHDSAFSPFHNFLIIFLKLLRKPVVIYGASMGPFKKIYKILARFSLNNVSLITLREEISYKYTREIDVSTPPIYITADPAFLLQPAPFEQVKEIMLKENINNNGPIIGMTVTRIAYRQAFPNLENLKEKYDKYTALIARLVDYLIETLNAVIVFIPHCIGPTEELDDRMVAEDIYQLVENKAKTRVIVNEYSPGELKGIIGQFDLFIGERIHSVINAISMCIPSIIISRPFDSRAYGIIGKMLGQKRWLYNIETMDFNSLASKIDDAWRMRMEIRKDLASRIETIKEYALLNGRLIKNLLNSVKRK